MLYQNLTKQMKNIYFYSIPFLCNEKANIHQNQQNMEKKGKRIEIKNF